MKCSSLRLHVSGTFSTDALIPRKNPTAHAISHVLALFVKLHTFYIAYFRVSERRQLLHRKDPGVLSKSSLSVELSCRNKDKTTVQIHGTKLPKCFKVSPVA